MVSLWSAARKKLGADAVREILKQNKPDVPALSANPLTLRFEEEGERAPELQCGRCKNKYPATLEFFSPMPKHLERVRSLCIRCWKEISAKGGKNHKRMTQTTPLLPPTHPLAERMMKFAVEVETLEHQLASSTQFDAEREVWEAERSSYASRIAALEEENARLWRMTNSSAEKENTQLLAKLAELRSDKEYLLEQLSALRQEKKGP